MVVFPLRRRIWVWRVFARPSPYERQGHCWRVAAADGGPDWCKGEKKTVGGKVRDIVGFDMLSIIARSLTCAR